MKQLIKIIECRTSQGACRRANTLVGKGWKIDKIERVPALWWFCNDTWVVYLIKDVTDDVFSLSINVGPVTQRS